MAKDRVQIVARTIPYPADKQQDTAQELAFVGQGLMFNQV